MKHKHHIIPKHMGGLDNEDNLVLLSVTQHARAHFDLWKSYGKVEDYIAWKCLSGRKLNEEDRIKLAKSGYRKFLLNEHKRSKWKNKISQSLTGRAQSDQTKSKRSNSLKLAYLEGRKRVTCNPERARELYYKNNMSSKLAEGRRKSLIWRDSVTSDEYKRKKTLADPRSKRVSVNGIIYNSIREASKNENLNYSKLRNLLITNVDDNIFFC